MGIFGNKLPVDNTDYFDYNAVKQQLEKALLADNSDKAIRDVLNKMIRSVSYSARMGIKIVDLYEKDYQYNNHMSRLVKDYMGFLNDEELDSVYNAAKSAFIPKTVRIKLIPVGIPSIDQMEAVLKTGGYLNDKLNIDSISYSYYTNFYRKVANDLSKIMILTNV